DDLQWADADSLALLAQLMRPPEAPALLLLATVRTADTESGPDSAESASSLLRGQVAHLPLGRMSPDEARQLADTLVRRAQGIAGLTASAIAQEAGGHPLFIDELIRYAAMVGAQSTSSLQLEEALWARISQLAPTTRQLLELVALAGGRLVQQTAAAAAGIPFGDFAKEVASLRVAHLLRTTGMRASDHVEPYHDRVRKAGLSHLEQGLIRAHDRRLALAFETTGQLDAEALAIHWREADDTTKAAHFARLAADKARKALAFDRAARFYQMCLELRKDPPTELRVAFAEALANAGRGGDAGRAYLTAAAH